MISIQDNLFNIMLALLLWKEMLENIKKLMKAIPVFIGYLFLFSYPIKYKAFNSKSIVFSKIQSISLN